jgi:hypothetical protein
MDNDLTLFTQLDEIVGIVNQLREKLEDTRQLAGGESYVSALTLYKLFGSAADAGVPGADAIVTQLKARFANQGGAATPPTPPVV